MDVLVSIIYALSLVLLSNTLHWDRYHTKLVLTIDNVVLIPICRLLPISVQRYSSFLRIHWDPGIEVLQILCHLHLATVTWALFGVATSLTFHI